MDFAKAIAVHALRLKPPKRTGQLRALVARRVDRLPEMNLPVSAHIGRIYRADCASQTCRPAAVVAPRRGTNLPFLDLNRFYGCNAVVVLGEPVCVLLGQVDRSMR